MPKYLTLSSYTVEGFRGLRKEGPAARRQAVEQAVQTAGGRVEAFYWALGEHDVVVISDLPNNITATALSLAINSTGAVRTTNLALLTEDEIRQALAQAVDYRPPGA